MAVTVGSTTTSPAERPEMIWVVESPTRPTVTARVVCLPLLSRETVEKRPAVVIADDGSSKAFETELTTTATLTLIPSLTVDGGLDNVIVSLKVTTLLTTVGLGSVAVTVPDTVVLARSVLK